MANFLVTRNFVNKNSSKRLQRMVQIIKEYHLKATLINPQMRNWG